MLFSSNISGYCSSVNSVTGNVVITSYTTGSTFWPTIANVSSANSYYLIARAYFQKMSPTTNIPGGMEEQKIYYLRKFANNVVKIYMTRTDAINAVNHVTFTTTASGYLFVIYFPDIYYRYLNAWKPAEPQIPDIPCCPPVPSVYTEIPDTATVTYNGQQITIKSNGSSLVNPNNTGGDKYRGLQGRGISAHDFIFATYTFTSDDQSFTSSYLVFLGIDFGHNTDPQNEIRPVLTLRLYLPNLPLNEFSFYEPQFAGSWTYIGNSSINTTKTMNFIFFRNEFTSPIYGPPPYLLPFLENILPSTIPVTFSGNTEPPSQVKVFMPDAYFPNKNKPINLGHVEEVLTYDPDTLTYWGDVRTYAGIEGRIHFSIPNYYPLTSSGTKYVNQSPTLFYDPNAYPFYRYFRYGNFADYHLNSWTNNEFGLYETCYVEHIIDNPGFEIVQPKLFLFVASDEYGGYPTGLPQGKTWFDSRIVLNQNPAWTNSPSNRLTKKMLIAFSKWGTAKFNKNNGVRYFEVSSTGNDLSHYTRNFFAIKSVHPNAHITSLGI